MCSEEGRICVMNEMVVGGLLAAHQLTVFLRGLVESRAAVL